MISEFKSKRKSFHPSDISTQTYKRNTHIILYKKKQCIRISPPPIYRRLKLNNYSNNPTVRENLSCETKQKMFDDKHFEKIASSRTVSQQCAMHHCIHAYSTFYHDVCACVSLHLCTYRTHARTLSFTTTIYILSKIFQKEKKRHKKEKKERLIININKVGKERVLMVGV